MSERFYDYLGVGLIIFGLLFTLLLYTFIKPSRDIFVSPFLFFSPIGAAYLCFKGRAFGLLDNY